jgi:hypothetical protein
MAGSRYFNPRKSLDKQSVRQKSEGKRQNEEVGGPTNNFCLLPSASAFPSQKEGDRKNARILFCLNFLRKSVYSRFSACFSDFREKG